MIIENFDNFNSFEIDESYLESNFAPLYHFTSSLILKEILLSDQIDIGYYDNPFNKQNIKFVSLTRNKIFKNYRDSNIRIELDKNKLKNDYKIISYDYFIHSQQEIYPKSNLKRKKEFEFEEIVLKNISNLHKYILSINIDNVDSFYGLKYFLILYIDKYNLNEMSIKINEQKINVYEL